MAAVDPNRADEGWIRSASFLCQLEPELRDRLLAVGQRLVVMPGDSLFSEPGAVLVLRGEVELCLRGEALPRRGGAGRLFGAGTFFGEASPTITAVSSVEAILFPLARVESIDRDRRIRERFAALAELEHRARSLDDILRVEPTLRLLPQDQREHLLQCCRVEELEAGAVVVEGRRRAEHVALLLRGVARLSAPGPEGRRTGQLVPQGTLLGVLDLSEDQAPVQPNQIEAMTPVRLLRIPVAALGHLAQRNRLLGARVHASSGGRRGQAHLIHSSSPGLGATTLNLGAAVALTQHARTVSVLDLDGARTARGLKLRPEAVRLGGIRASRVSGQAGLPEIWWPVEQQQAPALLDELLRESDQVMVNLPPDDLPESALLSRCATLVHLYGWPQERWLARPSGQQRVIHALRMPVACMPTSPTGPLRRTIDERESPPMQQTLRVPWDPAVAEVYAGQRVARQLGVGETPFGRSCERLARMLVGRAVGVALGGGGAWGFSHLGLLRALHEADIPIDYVAGTSFGAVVGAVWAARGMAGLDELEGYAWLFPAVAASCMVRSSGLGLLIDRICGPIHHLDTEIPMMAVAADVRTAAPYVLPKGTLADAVRASSGFPGLFAHYNYGDRRLVDGGIAANVPAQVVHEAGADFVLASNCIPRSMEQSPLLDGAPVIVRANDLIRSVLALMHRSSARDAMIADHVFNARVGDFAPYQFHAGPRIAALAYEQARAELPAIRAAYEADLTSHLA